MSDRKGLSKAGLGIYDLGEAIEVDLYRDYPMSGKYDGWYNCPHLRPDRTLPRVVYGSNEGGYAGVPICADCLVDALAKEVVSS